jgi:hypothetical protein
MGAAGWRKVKAVSADLGLNLPGCQPAAITENGRRTP